MFNPELVPRISPALSCYMDAACSCYTPYQVYSLLRVALDDPEFLFGDYLNLTVFCQKVVFPRMFDR